MREGLQKIVDDSDTIVAVSTPYGRSGIGVVRVSGSAARRVVQQFFTGAPVLEDRRAVVGRWIDLQGEIIDEVVATFFVAPNTYTGEDLLEVSAHGNPLILDRIVHTARSLGARVASPGEFTLRAVIHGKMDLIQAEAVRDFINAQTIQQASVARNQMEGALSRRVAPFKDELVNLIAQVEAGIDFSDDDVAPPESTELCAGLGKVESGLQKLQSTYTFGKLLREGLRVVIAGRPNVGKSSLFNKLIGTERAIVTEIPGTTRDVLSEVVSVEGIPLRFFDTAGLRDTTDEVEKIGVERALFTLSDADLSLVVVDGSLPLTTQDFSILDRTRDMPRVVVVNKCDLGLAVSCSSINGTDTVSASAKTGEGVEAIFDAIRSHLSSGSGEGPSDSMLTDDRHYDAVARSITSIREATHALASGIPHEMIVLDLYAALSSLNELTGETVTEDILGRIFSTFCIGK